MPEKKSGLPLYKLSSTAEGHLVAIVAVFNNVDSVNETILPGAFKDSITKKKPKGVWMHNWELPIALTTVCEELAPGDARLPDAIKDLGGLLIEADFNLDTQRGREAFSDVAKGLVDEYSIGYDVLAEGYKEGVRQLITLDLFEWSPVLVGANRATSTIGVKDNGGYEATFSSLVTEVESVLSWTKARVDMRKKEGRVLSASNIATISGFISTVKEKLVELEALIASATPTQKDSLEMRKRRLRVISSQLKTLQKWN